MSEQKLKRLSGADRQLVELTTSTNRRMAEDYRREQQRLRGRGVCVWCGSESCGHLWSRPGDELPGGRRCCDRCSHEPVEGWRHTHTAWDGVAPYPVCGVVMREGDVAYMRRDGVVQFIEMRAPAPGAGVGGAELEEVPTVAFLGQDGGVALYVAGEGAPEDTNLWAKKRELDVVWLPVRAQAAVARDQTRRQKIALEVAEAAARWELEENERRVADARRLLADIERRQLRHETVTVLREQEGGQSPGAPGSALEAEGDEELDAPEVDFELVPDSSLDPLSDPPRAGDGAAETAGGAASDSAPAKSPDASSSVLPAASSGAPVQAARPNEPAARLTRAQLKEPVPVKKTPGRPKRSKRQLEARKRQKRAWAVQEARQRLEVKRLERLGQSQAPGHDRGEQGKV